MKNGVELYKRIANRETTNQKWNDLSDEDRLKYYRIGQGIIASVKLHHADENEIARYLSQYMVFKKGL